MPRFSFFMKCLTIWTLILVIVYHTINRALKVFVLDKSHNTVTIYFDGAGEDIFNLLLILRDTILINVENSIDAGILVHNDFRFFVVISELTNLFGG